MVEFPVPLLPLLQLQSYLAPCISARIFIIPKLRNIYWREFIGEPSSLCIEHLPNCYSVRKTLPVFHECRGIKKHISHALPTEIIFHLLRSIPLKYLMRDCSAEMMLDTLETIIMWLQVSVSECNRQIPQTKNPIFV